MVILLDLRKIHGSLLALYVTILILILATFGIFVVDYPKDSGWVNFSDVFPSLLPIWLSLLSCLPCLYSQDSFIWKGMSSGCFLVASVVSLLSPTSSPPYWEKVWVKNLIPKVNIFFWLMLQNKILTTDNLCRRGFHSPTDFFYACRRRNQFPILFFIVLFLLIFGVGSFRSGTCVGSSLIMFWIFLSSGGVLLLILP